MILNVLKPNDITYLEEILLDENKCLRVVSYADLLTVPQNDISLFCLKHGYYCIPTEELIDFLKLELDTDLENTIEIGGGNGTIGNALGIMSTDNFMQDDPIIKLQYQMMKQATVPYGKDVVKIDANAAIKKYKPNNVIGAWVTHKYNPNEHWREGNMYGINERDIIDRVNKYIFIGNAETHKLKPILNKPHEEYYFPWLVSRSLSPDKNVIWIWGK